MQPAEEIAGGAEEIAGGAEEIAGGAEEIAGGAEEFSAAEQRREYAGDTEPEHGGAPEEQDGLLIPGTDHSRGNPYSYKMSAATRRDRCCGSAQLRERSRKYGIYWALAVAVVTVVAMAVYTGQAPGCNCPSCPNKWTKYDNICYFASKNTTVWKESQTYCEKEGGTLLILNDTVRKQIEELFLLQQDHWIGLTRVPGTKEWMWVNGSLYKDSVKDDADERLNCAYISGDIGALDCSTARLWICMKSI